MNFGAWAVGMIAAFGVAACSGESSGGTDEDVIVDPTTDAVTPSCSRTKVGCGPVQPPPTLPAPDCSSGTCVCPADYVYFPSATVCFPTKGGATKF